LFLLITLLTLLTLQQPNLPPCTVVQVTPVVQWRKQHPTLRFNGSTDTKLMVTLSCPNKEKLLDVPDDEWSAYNRAEIIVRLSESAIESIRRTADIPPLVQALQVLGNNGRELTIPSDVFAHWLSGSTEQPSVRTEIFYQLTGCPWGRPGDIDVRQCVAIR